MGMMRSCTLSSVVTSAKSGHISRRAVYQNLMAFFHRNAFRVLSQRVKPFGRPRLFLSMVHASLLRSRQKSPQVSEGCTYFDWHFAQTGGFADNFDNTPMKR